MLDPSVMAMLSSGGAQHVDYQNTVAGPSATTPVNGVGGSISAGVGTNFGGSLVGGVTLLMAAIVVIIYMATRGRQH